MKHIDTLYIYRTVKDIFDYRNILNKLLDDNPNFTPLGYANGRHWLKIENCRIGVMDYDKALRTIQYPFMIQYDWSYLFNLTKNREISEVIDDLYLPLYGDKTNYKINRVDFTITKRGLEVLPHVVSPFKSKTVITDGSGNVETVYCGKRSAGILYRTYNKTKELLKKEDYTKIDYYTHEFGTIEGLTVFELELHRKKFTQKIKDYNDTLDGLEQVYSLFQMYISKIKHYRPTEENLRNHMQNHHGKVKTEYDLTAFLAEEVKSGGKSERIEVNTLYYLPSFEFLVKTIERKIFNYCERVRRVDFDEIAEHIRRRLVA